MRTQTHMLLACWTLSAGLGLSLGACTDDGGSADGSSETGEDCQPGTEFCECLGGSVCEGDLECREGYCVEPGSGSSTGDGDGDTSASGDGDGDASTNGDGDGDGDASTSGDGDGDASGDGDGDASGDGDGDGDGDASTSGDGDGDGTGDGDGDGTGDGDGDPNVDPFNCEQLEFPVNVVNAGGYETITAAVAAAAPGATIEVCPGTYFENLVIERDLTLLGAGAETTILDGGGNASVIDIDQVDLTLEGFTITHGEAHANPLGGQGTCGGGVANDDSNGQQLNFSDCIFTENGASRGAAICSDGSGGSGDADLNFENLQIYANAATANGGGIFTYSDLTLTDCIIINNTADVYGGGLYLSYGTATVTGGMVRENSALEGGGAYIQSPFVLNVVDSDWGAGQQFENDPDDVGCYVDSFGFFGANANFTCNVPEYDVCGCVGA